MTWQILFSILDSSLFDLSMSRRDEKAEEDSPASLAVEALNFMLTTHQT
jgi:hypothetical protein